MQGAVRGRSRTCAAWYGKKQEWLDAAKVLLDFLEEHCINRTAGDRLYFTERRTAKPLRQRPVLLLRKAFTPSQRGVVRPDASGNIWSARAKRNQLVYDLNHGMPDPTGMGPKTIAETRTVRALADPRSF
jgi:N-acylglucosamine 2-epimerase